MYLAAHAWSEESFLTREAFDAGRTTLSLSGYANELAVALRRGRQGYPSLGDEIVAAPQDAVDLVDSHEVGGRFREGLARMSRGRSGAALRGAYGIADGIGRPAARLLVCATADAWFDQYARGFWEVTRTARTDPRIDIRAACNAIWTWGTTEHRALALALHRAYEPPTPQWPFAPFVELFSRVLGLHPAIAGATDLRARFMAQFAVDSLGLLGQGRTAEKNLFNPMMTALSEADPDIGFASATPPPGDRERLAAAALPVFRRVRDGSMDARRAAAVLADFAAAVEIADER